MALTRGTRSDVRGMRRTSSVVYWPGQGGCACVAYAAMIDDLPQDLIEALGPVRIGSRGIEILEAIERG